MKFHFKSFLSLSLIVLSSLGLAAGFWGCAGTSPNVGGQNRWSQLPVAARIINLPGESRNTGIVACFAEIRYRDIQFIRRDDGYYAEIEFTFSLTPPNNSGPERLTDRKQKLFVPTFAETVDRKNTLRIVEKFTVPLGDYVARIIAVDRNSRSQGIVSQPIRVKDLYSTLTISKPILMWDSVTTLNPKKMIAFRNRNYDKDFYALVIVGGLSTQEKLTMQYMLFDNHNETVYVNTKNFRPSSRVSYISLRIPANKLTLGTTRLKIFAQQQGREVSSQIYIYSTFGHTEQYTENIASYIEPMRYIMPKQEWQELVNAPPEKQTELFNKFWAARDPDPGDEKNPLLEEFFLRVEEANQRFNWGTEEGWKTDRGRIFIIYGPPDNVERRKSFRTGITYEIWQYYNLGRQFVFEDRYNNGNFRLYSS
ncbi:MAG: GWxTD domain-containing protein, partial [Calditrichaeota bacterium]